MSILKRKHRNYYLD